MKNELIKHDYPKYDAKTVMEIASATILVQSPTINYEHPAWELCNQFWSCKDRLSYSINDFSILS